MGRVSGIESLRATYSKEFVVELEPNLDDGKPWAVKLRQVRPIVYLAVGESIPVPAENGSGGVRFGKGDLVKKYEAMRTVVARSVASVREAVEDDNGTWSERWTPVTVVSDRPAAADEMHIDEIDLPKTQNVTKCWNALFADATGIERRAGFKDATFQEAGPLDAGGNVQALRTPAARMAPRRAGPRGR